MSWRPLQHSAGLRSQPALSAYQSSPVKECQCPLSTLLPWKSRVDASQSMVRLSSCPNCMPMHSLHMHTHDFIATQALQSQSHLTAENQDVKVRVSAYLMYLLCRGLLPSSAQALQPTPHRASRRATSLLLCVLNILRIRLLTLSLPFASLS